MIVLRDRDQFGSGGTPVSTGGMRRRPAGDAPGFPLGGVSGQAQGRRYRGGWQRYADAAVGVVRRAARKSAGFGYAGATLPRAVR